MFVNATNLDTVRIEVLGESMAITCPGGVWVEIHGRMRVLLSETEIVLAQLDELAEVWGDEGKFRRCRDRLRQAIADASAD